MTFMQRISFSLWLLTRPRSVRKLARKLPPWHTYRIKPTAQIAKVISYFENDTVRVHILDDSWQPFTRGVWEDGYEVFGYGLDDLEKIED